MAFRKIIGVAAILVILGVAVIAFRYQRQAYAFSDPSVPRNSPYHYTHSNVSTIVPLTNTAAEFFASLTISNSAEEITVTGPSSTGYWTEREYRPYTLHHANGSEPVAIDGGSVRLAYVATGYAMPKTNFGYSIKVPAEFYDADLKKVDRSEISSRIPEWEREVDFRGSFPAAKFFFISSNLPSFKMIRFKAFDARTKRLINQGYGSSSKGDMFWYGTELKLWHQTPIELVVTFATGEPLVRSITPVEGNELQFPYGVLKLIATSSNYFGHSSTHHNSTSIVHTFRAQRGQTHARSSLAFLGWPTGTDLPINLEFYGTNSQQALSAGSSSSSRMFITHLREELDTIEEVRLKYYPNIHRVVFKIPELPGLPDENRDAQNLFDVRIPMVRVEQDYDLRNAVSSLSAMEMPFVNMNFPAGYFPVTFTNTTARELLLEMEKHLPNPAHRLVPNPRENKIEIRKPPLEVLMDAIGKLLR